MKNLKLYRELSLELGLQSQHESLLLSAFDIENSRMFFASSANTIYTLHLPSFRNGKQSSKAVELDLEPGDCITAMNYVMDKEALILGTADGFLLLHLVVSNTTEIVGKIEGGIKSIASSPDEALVAIRGGLGQLLVMTQDWDVLYETAIDVQPSENLVNGDLSNPLLSEFQSPISWRGDGKYFAIIAETHNSSMQELKIWDRESGTICASSCSKAFSRSSLDWMPTGAKIAAAYDRKFEKKDPLIVLFEKNGLERSSFTIDEPVEAIVRILKWSSNGDLLAASISCAGYDAIKIWSFSNNHWYLKQEVRFSAKEGINFTWDPTNPLHLICWSLGGKVISYNFIWSTAVTETSVALVVDNCKMLVTPLSVSLVPPPMSLFCLKFHNAVQNIALLSKNTKIHLASCLSDGSLCIVEFSGTDSWEQFEDGEYRIETSFCDPQLGPFMHLTWLDSHMLLGVSFCQADSSQPVSNREDELAYLKPPNCHLCSFHEIEIFCSEDSLPTSINSSGWHAKVSKTLPLDKPVIGVVPNPAKRGSAFVQIDGGTLLEYTSSTRTGNLPSESHLDELHSDSGFTSSCPWMRAVLVGDNGIRKTLVFGLDDSGRLHLGKRILCEHCSSFSFYSSASGITEQVVTHLLLTTKNDLLFIFSMDDILHGNPETTIEQYHSLQNKREESKGCITIWERGAKLVGTIHGDEAAAILQTTRGNLECVYPRKLVLLAISNALLQERFKVALHMVRRHRIDFNFIVDYLGLQAFNKSATQFVCQVDNLSYITDFVSSIKNENVMEILYKDYVSFPWNIDHSENSPSFGTQSKVSCVLLAVQKALEEHIQESPARELCILTTLARSDPPALAEALSRIKLIREIELSGVDGSRRLSYPSAEESLKHLLWLTDPESLSEAALGLYDLNLAAMVAKSSQKDPKEFSPLLVELEQLPHVIMRYQIDLRLRRYESALKHIIAAGDDYYVDCMNLLKGHPDLFPLGLQLITDLDKRREVLEAWGNHLYGEKYFEDAATTFLCCSLFHKALKAYRACGDWKGALTVAGLLKLGKEEVFQLANELCEEFQALGKPSEAARIALEYCADVTKGVEYFILAREWEEALRIGDMHGRDDLVSVVKEAASDHATSLVSEYNEGTEKVGKYLVRYLAVRQRRLTLAAKLQSEDRLVDDAYSDNISETSSSFSEMSAYTMRTAKASTTSISPSTASKARGIRRQKKNGGKIRAGSPGEEMALVDHLKGMSLTDGDLQDLKSLLRVLVMIGKEETARQLQRVGETYQLSQQAAIKLAEDTMATEIIDENSHTLDHYMKKLGARPPSQCLPWQSKVFLPPR